MSASRNRTASWGSDHHVPCPGGCDQLSDECACPKPNPLGSMTITDPIGSTTHRPTKDSE